MRLKGAPGSELDRCMTRIYRFSPHGLLYEGKHPQIVFPRTGIVLRFFGDVIFDKPSATPSPAEQGEVATTYTSRIPRKNISFVGFLGSKSVSAISLRLERRH